jgi:hypothetical protein
MRKMEVNWVLAEAWDESRWKMKMKKRRERREEEEMGRRGS